ncbi:hypothetical protein EDM22_03960 [Agromyces tardus]|uniref:Uncharacterized protein n=1 Tax=Agromyces tardus TaxID=2583849 RepID=A0A3M8AKD4_9MICO|nr:hypothetical protein EDM22_03960 [Agromyces tardus]
MTSALLRYLAVAHYGHGRGAWRQSEYPPHWRPMVVDTVVAEQDRLAVLWSRRREGRRRWSANSRSCSRTSRLGSSRSCTRVRSATTRAGVALGAEMHAT